MTVVGFERREGVAVVTLDRPANRNAVDGEMARGIEAALDELEADDGLRVGILRATTTEPRPVFCAGNDLRRVGPQDDGDDSWTERGGFAGITRYPRTKPLIAAVDGLATSGGLEIVLACDLVVATARSSFALAEVRWGLVAGAGGLFRLPWALGRATAMDAILTATPVSAQRAFELGLVGTLVESDADAAAMERARLIAANSALAVSESLQVAGQAFSRSEAELWEATDRATGRILASPYLAAGLAAFHDRSR